MALWQNGRQTLSSRLTRNRMKDVGLFVLMEQLSSKGQSNQNELHLGSKCGKYSDLVGRGEWVGRK